MKRSVILTLCIILCLALSLGGTIAYLTDADGDVNVMTLGRVKITLEEFQRDGSGDLEEYEDGRMLYPQVGEDGGHDQYGLSTNSTFHDKIVRVTSNSSNANAYLRVWVGVPSAMLDVVGEEDAVHLVWGEGVNIGGVTVSGWPWKEAGQVETTVEKVPYTMFCYEYGKLFTPNEVTLPVLAGLYLDKRVDNGDDGSYTFRHNGTEHPLGVNLSGGLQVLVLAQAVQADGFSSAEQAFESAGMNNPELFDEYLDLEGPIQQLTQQVMNMIANLAAAMDNAPSGTDPYYVELAAATLDLNGEAGVQMNALAEQADWVTNSNGDAWQKDVLLEVKEENIVTINLGDVELTDNLVIVNEGGTLIINGEE